MPSVQQILERKAHRVLNIEEDATALDAARRMNENRVGALVVTRGDKVVGIFTERDILNRVVAAERSPAQTPVHEVMTAPVLVCTPQTTCDECRSVMRERRVRHLPVVDQGQLVGMVSIGDLYEAVEEDNTSTIQSLYEYMYGEWR